MKERKEEKENEEAHKSQEKSIRESRIQFVNQLFRQKMTFRKMTSKKEQTNLVQFHPNRL